MSAPNTTPGPWVVSQEANWPWDIYIHGPDWNIRRVAYSTEAKSIDDMRAAVGFPHSERAEIMEHIARQEADVRLAAASQDMYDALEAYMSAFGQALDAHGISWGPQQDSAHNAALAALAKARGEQ